MFCHSKIHRNKIANPHCKFLSSRFSVAKSKLEAAAIDTAAS